MRNPVQFQEGIGLSAFLALYGTEDQCLDALYRFAPSMHSVTSRSSSIGSIAGFLCSNSFPGLPAWRSEPRRCRKSCSNRA